MGELSYESFHKIQELHRDIIKMVVSECGTQLSDEEYEFAIADYMSNIVSLASCFILEGCQRVSEGNEEFLEELIEVSLSSMPEAMDKMIANLPKNMH